MITSIVVNTNNQKNVIKTLSSLLSQVDVENQIIIIDNASTDASWDVIQNYLKKHNPIGFAVTVKGKNVIAQRNEFETSYELALISGIGMGWEKSDTFHLCQSGDEMDKTFLKKHYETLNKNNVVGLTYCDWYDYNKNVNILKQSFVPGSFIGHNVVVSKKVLEEFGMAQERLEEFWKMIAQKYIPIHIPEVLVNIHG